MGNEFDDLLKNNAFFRTHKGWRQGRKMLESKNISIIHSIMIHINPSEFGGSHDADCIIVSENKEVISFTLQNGLIWDKIVNFKKLKPIDYIDDPYIMEALNILERNGLDDFNAKTSKYLDKRLSGV